MITDFFRAYGVPRDAAVVPALRDLATHVLMHRCYAMPLRHAAIRVNDALPNPTLRVTDPLPDPEAFDVTDVAALLLAVLARGPRCDWQMRWYAQQVSRWVLAVRCVNPATGRREPTA